MLDPFSYLASAAGKVIADGWTAAMLGLWNAGLWLLKLVLGIVDDFTTPDLSEGGPAGSLYRVTSWIGLSLMLILTVAQLGIAAFRRDGRSVGQVLVGTGQFLLVWVAWIGYGIAVLAACGGLTKALMTTLLHVDSWAQFSPLGSPIDVADISDGTVATVLGLMGIVLVFAAIGHLLVLLTRAGALMVLAATTPISAAGLSSDFGRSWFWKSFRWFHAAAFTPVLMVLVLGVGVQMTSGVATGMTDDLQKAIGTAVPGVILICIGCASPLALFKLLAFTDPGTSSGAALRAGMAAQGGLSGVLARKSSAGDSTSTAASSTDEHGRSQAEGAGESSTSSRFGGLAAAGLGLVATVGARGAAMGADLTNQMGVGDSSYVPDFSSDRRNNQQRNQQPNQRRDDDNPAVNGADGNGTDGSNGSGRTGGTDGRGQPSSPSTPSMPATPSGTGPGAKGMSEGSGSSGIPAGTAGAAGGAGAAGAAGGTGGAAAASAVPAVPA
ncbi:type IV secretion system protein [Humibacillus xanthopallidus]|uniref:TrbL/VirB6 plasmid conjugal transfer protein n=1 Tax=Humibacillus xanthopallidus TaxID=412689 RepID=A0A543HHN9_9MICO|nr:type IV secretion system protein [Humibacillus xanthopallidus]TQM57842.1 TrbL/VirB6 plasmid conjugal transfer protein [Humibacillus xanthopallidus]